MSKIKIHLSKVNDLTIKYFILQQSADITLQGFESPVLIKSLGDVVIISAANPDLVVTNDNIQVYIRGNITEKDNSIKFLAFKNKEARDVMYSRILKGFQQFKEEGYFNIVEYSF